jgi:hypothetical protein
VSITLDEEALDRSRILFGLDRVRDARAVVESSGVLRVDQLGLSLQAFPADRGLAALAACCDPREGDPVFGALENAARAQLVDGRWRLGTATADPVRYKPANRCVIRYKLTPAPGSGPPLTVFGKVYADLDQARRVQALQGRLYEEQSRRTGSSPVLPRPLGLVEPLGLTITETVRPAEPGAPPRTGTEALRAHPAAPGNGSTPAGPPDHELGLAARALASLHLSSIDPGAGSLRTGAREAKRARERAGLIAARNPGLAERSTELAARLATALDRTSPPAPRLAHGGFKSSQLLFHSGRAFIVDFDGLCLADPALDTGYFLAYLRPSGLWYGRGGMRAWFDGAARVFVDEYRHAMLAGGAGTSELDGVISRSRLYEAALLFKIATRRVNRLNSPRPKELAAMLDEIEGRLEP